MEDSIDNALNTEVLTEQETQAFMHSMSELEQFNGQTSMDDFDRVREEAKEHVGAASRPGILQGLDALAAGAATRTDQLSMPLNQELLASLEAPDESNQFEIQKLQNLIQGAREAASYGDEGREAVGTECSNIARGYLDLLQTDNQLTADQRKTMAVSILFASQLAEPEAGLVSFTRANLDQITKHL